MRGSQNSSYTAGVLIVQTTGRRGQAGNDCRVIFGQCEIKETEVFALAFYRTGFGQGNCPQLVMPAQDHLPVTWALAGLGLTQKSFWEVASHLADGSLQTVLDAYEPEPVSFFAIHPVRVAQSRKVGLFIDAAVTWFDGFGEP